MLKILSSPLGSLSHFPSPSRHSHGRDLAAAAALVALDEAEVQLERRLRAARGERPACRGHRRVLRPAMGLFRPDGALHRDTPCHSSRQRGKAFEASFLRGAVRGRRVE